MLDMTSTIVWSHLKAKNRMFNCWKLPELGNELRTWRFMLSLMSSRDGMGSRYTVVLRYLRSQMLQGFESRDLGGQTVSNCRLMILSSKKWQRSNWFTPRAMYKGAPSCINIVVVSHSLAWRARITDCSNNEAYLSPVTVYVTLPVVWSKISADISVTTESSAYNFLQPDLLDPLIWNLPAIRCEDISSPWSTMIPSHLNKTLRNRRTWCA